LDHDESVASALLVKLHTEALQLAELETLQTALRRLKFASTLHEHVSEARAQAFTRYMEQIRGVIGSICENVQRELKASLVREEQLKQLLSRLHTLVRLGDAYAPEAASALEGIRANFIATCAPHSHRFGSTGIDSSLRAYSVQVERALGPQRKALRFALVGSPC
jgi:DNA repair ATPase RecN